MRHAWILTYIHRLKDEPLPRIGYVTLENDKSLMSLGDIQEALEYAKKDNNDEAISLISIAEIAPSEQEEV